MGPCTAFHAPGWIFALIVAAAASLPPGLRAQDAPRVGEAHPAGSGALYEELARMDSLLFDASFVSCDPGVANAMLADDVEFYHDRAGFQSAEQTRENTRLLTASCPAERGITRVLVAESLRVYPIHDYGAVQVGVHRFEERGAPTHTMAQFVHLWHRQDGAWRLARILSFDHREEPAAPLPGVEK